MAAGISGGSVKTGKRGKKTTAGISGGSVKDKRGKKMTAGGITVGRVERGKKMAADGGSQSTRTSPRKRLFDTSKEKTVKRKI